MILSIFNSRTILSLAVGLLICFSANILLRHSGIELTHFQNQWIKNYAVAEGFIYEDDVPEIVVVGSSMAARLDSSVFDGQLYNMAFNSIGYATGLEILKNGSHVPDYVLLEANIIENKPNEEMINRLYYPIMWKVKKWLAFLQHRYQPINFVVSVVNQKFGRSDSEEGQSDVSTDILNREIKRHLAYNNLVNSELDNTDLTSLREGILSLEERGVKVMLFMMPVDPRISDSYRYTTRAELISKQLGQWPLIVSSKDNLHLFTTTDGIHLTPKGASEYTLELHRTLVDYRLPFFEMVRDELASRGIEFVLVYGSPDPFEGSKVKMEYPDWGIHAKTRIFKVKGRYLYWLSAFKYVKRGDFVVAEHAAKLLDNYLFYTAKQLGRIDFGYFGHGQNFQAKSELPVSSWLKKMTLSRVTRWFAYTEVSRQSLLRQGVDDSAITVVNNALVKPAIPTELENLTYSPSRFIYVGGLYNEKLIPFLLKSCELAAEEIPGFELHVAGTGPDSHYVVEAAEKYDWLSYHGPLYGDEKHKAIIQSGAILMPGLVGLIAVDSFFYKRPIITSDMGEHSPEIAYLQNDTNCLIDTGEVTHSSFSRLMVQYASDAELRQKLIDGCIASSKTYTIENMVSRFCGGIAESNT